MTFDGVELPFPRDPERGPVVNLGALLRALRVRPLDVLTVPLDPDRVIVDLAGALHILETASEISEAHLERAQRLTIALVNGRHITAAELQAAMDATAATDNRSTWLGRGGDA